MTNKTKNTLPPNADRPLSAASVAKIYGIQPASVLKAFRRGEFKGTFNKKRGPRGVLEIALDDLKDWVPLRHGRPSLSNEERDAYRNYLNVTPRALRNKPKEKSS